MDIMIVNINATPYIKSGYDCAIYRKDHEFYESLHFNIEEIHDLIERIYDGDISIDPSDTVFLAKDKRSLERLKEYEDTFGCRIGMVDTVH